jgi:hypothetical protein
LLEELILVRTRAQTVVFLTSREDLKITEDPNIAGIDLIVSIMKKKKPTFRQFGLILHGHLRGFTSMEEASTVLDSLKERETDIEPALTPICIFSFPMTGRKGVYAWWFEPVIGEQGPRLQRHDILECRKLDKGALAGIVEQVDDFYNAVVSLTNS